MEAIKTANGYKIRTIDALGRYIYIASIYRGKIQYTTDYTHARTYTEAGANKIIQADA